MEFIKAHTFLTIEEGLEAMKKLNECWELPVENGISCFGEHSLEKHANGFWWCHSSEWTEILGDPDEIELLKYEI